MKSTLILATTLTVAILLANKQQNVAASPQMMTMYSLVSPDNNSTEKVLLPEEVTTELVQDDQPNYETTGEEEIITGRPSRTVRKGLMINHLK